MNIRLLHDIDAWVYALLLFAIMLICIWLGARTGKKKAQKKDYIENESNKTIFGSVFGLLAFLLAFTFGMGGSRYEARRSASIAEANAIGTAILRADLYPEEQRNAFRADFKDYLQARIDYLKCQRDDPKISEYAASQQKAGNSLWKRAMTLSVNAPSIIPSNQMIPALNEMFDSATSNDYSELMKVPQSIVTMLFILSFVSAFFMGYISGEKGKIDWYIAMGFCFLSAMVIYITLDLDRPRRGLIQLDVSHNAIFSQIDQFKGE
ncbi:bestrophin-like domain [Flavobacterium hauense]